MANIDEDLQKIKNAVKGAEVRDSIHDAIRDINDQTENILSDVQTQVSGIVDDAINDNVLLFKYDPGFFVDEDIHTDNSITWDEIAIKPLTYIQIQWHITDERSLTVFNSTYDCIGITVSAEESVGYLYFNNTYTGTIIKVTIPITGSNDVFSFTEITQSGLQPGTGINISNNTVSVDTTEIQEKLIAGTGITIVGNTISSTGGGTSDIVTVVYTFNFSTEECTCDTSYNDILTAYNNGKTIIPLLKQDSVDYVVYPGVFTYISNMIELEFSIVSRSSTGGVQLNYISITHIYDDVELADSIQAARLQGYGEKYTEGTGIDITNNVIGISEEIQDTIEANTMIGSSSGSISTFTDGVDLPLNKLVVGIEDDTNRSYFQGLLNGTYGFVNLGNLTYIYSSNVNRGFNSYGLEGIIKPSTNYYTDDFDYISPIYVKTASWGVVLNDTDYDNTIVVSPSGIISIVNHDYSDATTFKQAMNGVYLIYELETPITPTITDAEYQMLLNAFGVGVSECDLAIDSKYGGFIDFNQLIKSINTITSHDVKLTNNGDGSYTLYGTASDETYFTLGNNNIAGHKYFYGMKSTGNNAPLWITGYTSSKIFGTEYRIHNQQGTNPFGITISNGTIVDETIIPIAMDLTQMFGETKANEIYAMEQTQAGSGVAYVKSLFPNDYYPYTVSTPNTTVDTVNGVTNRIYHIDFPSGVTISNGSIDILNGVLTDDDLSEEYNITPVAIRSLEGVNNIFADTGDIEECKYIRDATTIINEMIESGIIGYSNGNGIDITGTVISAKTKSNGGVLADSSGLYVDDTKFQTKLTSSNAGNGISINNGVISINLQNAEDNSF